MRKITYKTLTIQNFLSVGNDTITIDFQNGLNLITGNNIDNPERRNGTGKSAIIESFYYALFGKTIREIKKEFIINNVTKGKGNISLKFDLESEEGIKSYTINRQIKPSKVELLENDVDITRDSISNTDKFICDLLGTNSVLCKSCDILSLSDNIPFMAKSAQDKRKFIEDIFSLEIFGKMTKDLKDLLSKNKTNMNISNAKIEEISNSLATLERQREAFQRQLDEREEKLTLRKEEIIGKINDIEQKIDEFVVENVDNITLEIEKYHSAWTSIDGKLANIVTSMANKEADVRKISKDIQSASSVEGIKCNKCLQDIPESHISHIDELKFSLNSELSIISDEIALIKADKQSWLNKKSKIQNKIKEFL